MDISAGAELCFPHHNASCRKAVRPRVETALLYTLFSTVATLTVALNLLVIISISHFRQLRTPANTLLLSLAVSDLLVGLLVMPIETVRFMETCWLLGKLMCALTPFISYCLLSASVGNLVLISIDRYVAICDPLLYSSKITLGRVQACIGLCWVCSVLYNGLILMGHLREPDRFNSCYGECVVVISHDAGTVDLLVTFLGPCTVMVVLYTRVFVAVLSQARIMHPRTRRVAVSAATVTVTVTVKRSEMKAARTLGIVIVVFLMCFCPYYYPSVAGQDTSNSLSYFTLLSWIMLVNSCLNPLIYAIFYPWFKKAIKFIFTMEILRPDSCDANIL